MFANSQITTLLLLAVVGYLIYHLTQPGADVVAVNQESNDAAIIESNTEVSGLAVENSMAAPVELEEEAQDAAVVEEAVAQATNETGVGGMSADAGASLSAAFMGAVPPGTAVDQVDFNRNNVSEYDSAQYLPQEVNDEWFDTDFTKAKYNLNDDKLINTNRYIIGVNTVGQSLKNPSYDIRGTIPNPKYTVSPWNNSTYEPDNNLKPLY